MASENQYFKYKTLKMIYVTELLQMVTLTNIAFRVLQN